MKIAEPKALPRIEKALYKYIEFVAPTYGPAGKKILIAHNEFSLKAVDDGHEGVKELELENEFENAVIQYIKETTKKTNERAGDGTTTASLLMGAIFKEVVGDPKDELRQVKGNYHKEIREVETGIKQAVSYIKDKAKKVKTKQELYKIAYNSYNNEEIAELISDTLFKIGEDGLITIGDSQTAQTEIEMVEGLELEKGYVSPYFINSPKEETVINDAAVVLINQRIESFADITPVFIKLRESHLSNVCIVADGFGEEAIAKTIMMSMTQGFRTVFVEAPGFGENKLENLHNIAVVTGGKVIDPKIGKLSEVTADYFGSAKQVVAKKGKTLIVGGAGSKEAIKARISVLSDRIQRTTAVYDKEQLQKHIASLKGGIAVIKVGASTENEQKAIKAKVEDSVNATKLAFKDGIVKGGGKTYAEIKTSSDILNRALKYPLNQLKENGEEYLDENVTDPAGVLIAALETGGSIACGLLSIGGIITTKREEDKD